jgi:hypothetical protein
MRTNAAWTETEFKAIKPGDIYCHDPGFDGGWLCITRTDDQIISLELEEFQRGWEYTTHTTDTDDIWVWRGNGLPYG